MNKVVVNSNIERLKAMHNLVREIDDERAYMTWIALAVPDEPDESTFRFIAEDKEMYNDCVSVFKDIINSYEI